MGKNNQERSTTLKKIGQAIWKAVMGKGPGKLEKALKDGITSQKKKLKIMKKIEK